MATIFRAPLVSARLPKRPIAAVDYFSRPLTLGINPNAAVSQLYESAPPRKKPVQVDCYPNLLATTLKPAGAVLDLPLFALRLDASAPAVRTAYRVDQPIYRSIALNPVPLVQRLDQSATPRKRQVRVDTTPNPVILQQPKVASLFDSAPRTKSAVQVDGFPNNRTLFAPLAPLNKPLGYPYDFSTFQPKYEIELDAYPNTILLGIAEPPEIIVDQPRRRRIVVKKVERTAIIAKDDRSILVRRKRRDTLQ